MSTHTNVCIPVCAETVNRLTYMYQNLPKLFFKNVYKKIGLTILEEFAAHFVVLDLIFCRIGY